MLNNNDIPCVLAVLGAILNCIVGGLSVESIVYGALMGLASTGLHQAFTKFIERTEESNTNVTVIEVITKIVYILLQYYWDI